MADIDAPRPRPCTGSDEGRVGHPRPDPQVPRAELISRKSPERFKLGFKTVTRPLVRHSIHVLAPDSRTDIGRAAIHLARKKPEGTMMVEFVLFLAVAIAPLAAIAVFATGGEDSPGGKKGTDSHKYD